VLAYKFLHPGHRGLYSGYTWPVGEWVDVKGTLVPSRRGIHACRERDLAHWLDDELWLAELDGTILEEERMLVAGRGRLVSQVPDWDGSAMRELAQACLERGRDYPESGDAEGWASHPAGAVSAFYMVAHAAGLGAEEAGGAYDAGFDDERAWQAGWIARRFGLEPLA
jgi:hypothetical protein